MNEEKIKRENQNHTSQNGITLIALIITIIVMLVLVGVTINVSLNGGLFEKGEKAAYQTNIATINEMLALKKAEILADNNGRTPDKYNIEIGDIGLSQKLVDEFKDKLTISEDGTLYYIDEKVNEKEKVWLEELGITIGSSKKGGFIFDTWYVIDNKKYVKFSQVGDRKIEYSYILGSGTEENIVETDYTSGTWNESDSSLTVFYEEYQGVPNVTFKRKWIENKIIYETYIEEYGLVLSEEGEMVGTEDYPFEFCYHVIFKTVGDSFDYIANISERESYVGYKEDYKFKFEVTPGKTLEIVNVWEDGVQRQYTFQNNELIITDVRGRLDIQISCE